MQNGIYLIKLNVLCVFLLTFSLIYPARAEEKVRAPKQLVDQERQVWQCKPSDSVCEFPVFYEVCVRKKSNKECAVWERVDKVNLSTEIPGEPKYKMSTHKFEKEYFQSFPHYFPLPEISSNPDGSENVRSRIATSLRTHPPAVSKLYGAHQEPENENISNPSRNINLYTFRCSTERQLTTLFRKQSLVFQRHDYVADKRERITHFTKQLNDTSFGLKSNVLAGITHIDTLFPDFASVDLDQKISMFADLYDNKRIVIPGTTQTSRLGEQNKIEFKDEPLIEDDIFAEGGLYNRLLNKPNWTNLSPDRVNKAIMYHDTKLAYRYYKALEEIFGLTSMINSIKPIEARLLPEIAKKRESMRIGASKSKNGLNALIDNLIAVSLKTKAQDILPQSIQAAREGTYPDGGVFGRTATAAEIKQGLIFLNEYVIHAQKPLPKDPLQKSVVEVFRMNKIIYTSRHQKIVESLYASGKSLKQRKQELDAQNFLNFGPQEVKDELQILSDLRWATFKTNQYYMAKGALPLYIAHVYWYLANWVQTSEADGFLNSLQKNIDQILLSDRFTNAEQDCAKSIEDGKFPLPIGAVFGALRSKNNKNKNLGFTPDITIKDSNGKDLKLIEIELVYLPNWSHPLDFAAIEGAGVPQTARNPGQEKWRNEQREMSDFKTISATLRLEVIKFIESIFASHGFSGVKSGERSITEVQRRYFVNIDDLMTLRDSVESTSEKKQPSHQQIFSINNYWEFLRSTGGSGFLIKPDFYKELNSGAANPGKHIVQINKDHTKLLVDFGTSNDTKEINNMLPKSIAQLSKSNIYLDLKKSMQSIYPNDFSDSQSRGLSILNKMMAHSFYVPVDVMVKAAQIRKQAVPTEQCFQYVKDAALIGQIIDQRPAGNANSGALTLRNSTFSDGYVNNFAGISALDTADDVVIDQEISSEDATQNTGLGNDKLNDIFLTGDLPFLCKKIIQSVTDNVRNSPKGLEDRVCAGAPSNNDKSFLKDNSHLSKINIPNIKKWLTEHPFVECLAPYASIVFYKGGKYGHVEVKTEEVGLCGFVSDFYDFYPISQSLKSQGNQNNLKGQRTVQEIQIVKIPGI